MIQGNLTIHRLLGAMKKVDASDLHIKVGIPPAFRVNGVLKLIDATPLTEDEADHFLDPILTPALKARFEATGNIDFATSLPDGDRFRVDIFRSGAHTHAAIRRVKSDIPTYGVLHLPPVYSKIIETTMEGLVLVVGVTGSGKSSTLAAMIEHINATRADHIITIEDPVEYRFTAKKSIISQREIGIDVETYGQALKYVVRQDPDVIFIGEMRDHDTVLAAIQAAETGHLVFGSLHTADTMQAISRILEFFEPKDHAFVRGALANTLKAICAQRLLPTVPEFLEREGGVGVVPATEVLLGTPLVKDKIREGQDTDLPSIINSSTDDGMHSLTQSLGDLVKKEWVSRQVAMDFAPNREALDSLLKGLEVKVQTLIHRVKRA
ncbi:MAG: PilT/PilU family type 4a pilus ATPase [Phycisphaeraceae bacterium]|nr:MAG: PilT/PilU family type 4a pilus ATPase [Phycisphaeraceae bacterium]